MKEKLKMLLMVFVMGCAVNVNAQDILVTNDGTSMKVYNIEIGGNSVFYQLAPDSGAIQKMVKADVLIIRLANGKKIDPNATTVLVDTAVVDTLKKAPIAPADTLTVDTVPAPAPILSLRNPSDREPVRAEQESDMVMKRGRQTFTARTDDGCELEYEVISNVEKRLLVVGLRSQSETLTIPDFVELENGDIYTVVEIKSRAFKGKHITDAVFPATLRKIGDYAFQLTKLGAIILPDGLEEIGVSAFAQVGVYGRMQRMPVSEIYVPRSVKRIGKDCFFGCGDAISAGGKCKAYFSCLPAFVKEANCENMGIDKSAVKTFRNALKGN